MTRLAFEFPTYVRALYDFEPCGKGWGRPWIEDEPRPHIRDAGLHLERDPVLAAHVVTRAWADFDAHLSTYTPLQLAAGTFAQFDSSQSSTPAALTDETWDVADRAAFARCVDALRRRVFERFCAPVLGHLDEAMREPATRRLNTICYMWWDVCAVSPQGDEAANDVFLASMRAALSSANIAVVEHGLHGLGHSQQWFPSAKRAIEAYLASGRANVRTELRRYAERALDGMIN